MFPLVADAKTALERTAREFDTHLVEPAHVVRLLEELATIRRLVDGIVARTAKYIDDCDAHLVRGDRSANALVARTLGTTTTEASAAIDTARKLAALPETAAAVERGELNAREAALIATAATENPDAEQHLLEQAREGLTPLRDACQKARAAVEDPTTRSERQHKLRSFKWWTDDDGMVAGRFRLTPETGAAFVARIDAAVQKTFRARRKGQDHEPHEAYAADALVAEGAPTSPKHTVHVVLDYDVLRTGHAVADQQCEIPGVGPVNPEWVKSILGEAFLTAVVKKGKDITTVAHLGRYVPVEIQTALIVGGRECDAEGCHARGYLERDHTHDYAKGGLTAYWNLRWLCWIHHQRKTRGEHVPMKQRRQ